VVGYKLGLTSRPMQEMLGVDEPDYGPVLAAGVHGDGMRVDLDRLIQPKVEAEIAIVLRALDVAESLVRPLRPAMGVIDRAGLLLGYAGVYGSFLLHAQRAAARFDVDVADVLLELGRRKAVGGQEDMILDVALELAGRRAEPPEGSGDPQGRGPVGRAELPA